MTTAITPDFSIIALHGEIPYRWDGFRTFDDALAFLRHRFTLGATEGRIYDTVARQIVHFEEAEASGHNVDNVEVTP